MIKLLFGFLLVINNMIFAMEKIEEDRVSDRYKSFAGVSASGTRDSSAVCIGMTSMVSTTDVEGQIRSLLTQRDLRQRRGVSQLKLQETCESEAIVGHRSDSFKFQETREGQAIVLLAQVFDKKNQLQVEELRMAEEKSRRDNIHAQVSRRNACIVTCCSMAISLGGLALSFYNTYRSKTNS